MDINSNSIIDAYKRISKLITLTPVHTSSSIDAIVGKNVYFKCENFQKTGSFKIRGALNAILKKIKENPNNSYSGCVTHSSGNHGTAVSYASKTQNIDCIIVLPKNTPQNKIDAVKAYHGKIELCENNPISRQETCERLSKSNNLLIIPPYDDYDVMSGQGTIAYEFLNQIPHLDAMLVSVSGGGLISGISIYAKSINPNIKIFAVEPENKNLNECLKQNNRNIHNKPQSSLNTLAEGIRMEQCGVLTFPIMHKYIDADDVFTVTDEEMIQATKLVFKRMKLVIELSAGAAVAAVLSNKMINNYPNLKNIGVLLCGGNIDIDKLPF